MLKLESVWLLRKNRTAMSILKLNNIFQEIIEQAEGQFAEWRPWIVVKRKLYPIRTLNRQQKNDT